MRESSVQNAARFNDTRMTEGYLSVYEKVLRESRFATPDLTGELARQKKAL
jgi:hypothetical protein